MRRYLSTCLFTGPLIFSCVCADSVDAAQVSKQTSLMCDLTVTQRTNFEESKNFPLSTTITVQELTDGNIVIFAGSKVIPPVGTNGGPHLPAKDMSNEGKWHVQTLSESEDLTMDMEVLIDRYSGAVSFSETVRHLRTRKMMNTVGSGNCNKVDTRSRKF